jgi:hypothetical protein
VVDGQAPLEEWRRAVLDHLGLSPPEEPKLPPAVPEVVRVPVDEEGWKLEGILRADGALCHRLLGRPASEQGGYVTVTGAPDGAPGRVAYPPARPGLPYLLLKVQRATATRCLRRIA